MYKIVLDPIEGRNGKIGCILRLADMANIPPSEDNMDYQRYLKWLEGYEWNGMQYIKVSDGNEPIPPDPLPELPSTIPGTVK